MKESSLALLLGSVYLPITPHTQCSPLETRRKREDLEESGSSPSKVAP